jgi:Ca2+-binding RTX toxin-like protein
MLESKKVTLPFDYYLPRPIVCSIAEGKYLEVWREFIPDDPSNPFIGQLQTVAQTFNSDGTNAGLTRQILPATFFSETSLPMYLVKLSNEKIGIFWLEDELRIIEYDPINSTFSDVRTAVPSAHNFVADSDAIVVEITIRNPVDNTVTSELSLIRDFDSNPISILGVLKTDAYYTSYAAVGENNLVTNANLYRSRDTVELKFYDVSSADGILVNVVDAASSAGSPVDEDESKVEVKLERLGNGNVLVTWHVVNSSNSSADIHSYQARIFDELGNALTDIITVETSGTYIFTENVDEADNGDLLFTWVNRNDIFARYFGPNGTPAGEKFLLQTFPDPTFLSSYEIISVNNEKIALKFEEMADPTNQGSGQVFRMIELNVARYTGTDTADVWNGTHFDDTVRGMAGNDTLGGGLGNDRLYGGTGDDTLVGNSGRDLFSGEGGIDRVTYYNGKSATAALDGSFKMSGAATGDSFIGIENLVGSNSGNDRLAGNQFENVLYGFGGNDRLHGRDGDDTLIGGTGSDTLDGGSGQDTVSYVGTKTGLRASLTDPARNTRDANGDRYVSIENVYGTSFADELIGNALGNRLSGSSGADNLVGLSGNDTLMGGRNNDTLRGGQGADALFGGLDKDRFFFASIEEGGDRILDFEQEDSIVLIRKNFGNIPSSLEYERFLISNTNSITVTNDYFLNDPVLIFRENDSSLWYDSDGSGKNVKPELICKMANGFQLNGFLIEFI